MLTDKEKEIALECGIPLDKAGSFLSRIREEQKPVAWIDEYNWLIRKKPIPVEGVTGTVFKPLFTTPPATPDCSELVEALEFAQEKLLESAHPYDAAAMRINEALANHAKRMKEESK